MKKLYNNTTLVGYDSGEFFALPIWMIEEEFELATRDENIQAFIDAPLEKKKELQNDCVSDIAIYQSKLDYASAKMHTGSYLVLPIEDELRCVSVEALKEVYKEETMQANILKFLVEDNEKKINIVRVFKLSHIREYGESDWNEFMETVKESYESKVADDEEYYKENYSG